MIDGLVRPLSLRFRHRRQAGATWRRCRSISWKGERHESCTRTQSSGSCNCGCGFIRGGRGRDDDSHRFPSCSYRFCSSLQQAGLIALEAFKLVVDATVGSRADGHAHTQGASLLASNQVLPQIVSPPAAARVRFVACQKTHHLASTHSSPHMPTVRTLQVTSLNCCFHHLVGPQCLRLKVSNSERFHFKPREMLAALCAVFLSLARGSKEGARESIIGDSGSGRSLGCVFLSNSSIRCKNPPPRRDSGHAVAPYGGSNARNLPRREIFSS